MQGTLTKAFHFYSIYKGLQLHFQNNSKYDFSAYGPLKNLKIENFENSNDRFQYIKLLKMFNEDEKRFIDYLSYVALKNGKVPYVRSLLDVNLYNEYIEKYDKQKSSILYSFNMFIDNLDLNDFKTDGTKTPKIIENFLNGDIFVDIYLICDIIFGLSSKYEKLEFYNDILMQEEMNKYKRYKKLMIGNISNSKNFSTYKEKIKQLINRKS